jgi:peptidoglycan/LPS O-acetylase OafA/YrhL
LPPYNEKRYPLSKRGVAEAAADAYGWPLLIIVFCFLFLGWPWFLFSDHGHAWGWAVVGVLWDLIMGGGLLATYLDKRKRDGQGGS